MLSIMLNRYLNIAWRNLRKDRFYTLINVTGLAVAMAAFLLIINYVKFEHSYENFYTKADHIYRVTLDLYKDGAYVVTDCETHPPMAPAVKKQLPEVKDYVRVQRIGRMEVATAQHQAFMVDKVYAADPSFFSIFNCRFIKGNPATALTGAMDAVITQRTAAKLFGNLDPIGQTLNFSSLTVTVTGVIKDQPENTHLKYNILLSLNFVTRVGYDLNSWGANNNFTYLEMAPHTNLDAFNAKLKAFSREHLKDKIFKAEPIKDIHLHSKKTYEPEVNSDIKTVQFMLAVAFLILLIGTINYVNLTTARAAERLKEASIKKILGANRRTLVKQFFTESLLINMMAFVLALLLIQLCRPLYANIVGEGAATGIFSTSQFWMLSIALFLLNGVLSGLYPAIALSSVKAVAALNRSFTNTLQGGALRRTLVIGQFTIAAVVLVAAIIVYRQLSFMRSQDLGMNLDQVMVIKAPELANDSTSDLAFKHELLQLAGISRVAMGDAMPGMDLSHISSTSNITRVGGAQKSSYNYYLYGVDADFVPVMGIKMAAGRNFIAGASDKNEVLINEEAARLLGFTSAEAAVGSKLNFWGGQPVIAGVMKNYHQLSLKDALLPMVHRYEPRHTNYFAVKIQAHNIRNTVANVEKKWQTYFRDHPFEYFFLDDNFNQQYQADARLGKIVAIFSIFTIFITCLGLLGLTTYSVSRRTREIGIRKVLGASVTGIVHLLTKDFIRLVIIAVAIATPLAWWTMNKWLQDFAYRISIPWWAFAMAGMLMIVVALLTISLQSVKAALMNPVKSLRSE
jgi:putative ABC transport system permease protein